MPLLDHFHPPLSERFPWKSFHHQWAAVITADLNARLPEGWRAEADVRFGLEVDVGAIDERPLADRDSVPADGLGWSPAAPALTIPFVLTTDVVEVRVFASGYSPELVGALELVSPANKDRPAERDAFVAKCETLLGQGAGLVVVDIVTRLRANLHAELLARHGEVSPTLPSLYAAAYHPRRGSDADHSRLAVWIDSLTVGAALATVPLFLRVGPMMPIDLETTYARTCRDLRIPSALPEV